ncbi:PepSY domain-containing protein [Psychrobacillus sp.]|uniref:PepSY domain-containing protein n=1 Tax=Psychrobacillus sp. TaxID=1871623 RepID=UPI0028BDC482|nr:PepSY domain-containing protein [Psychrobacillus sp.]
MKFFQKKKFLPIFMATIVVAGTTILVYATKNHQSISENEVRSQLEQMYSAEVADLTMGQDQDIYEAIITKSGAMYMVEMNAVTGDVLSLTEADEYIIKDKLNAADEPVKDVKEEPKTFIEKTEHKKEEKLGTKEPKAERKVVKEEKTAIATEKLKNDTKATGEVKTTKPVEKSSVKTDDPPAKVDDKTVEQKEEKSKRDVIKEVIKDVLKTEDEKAEQTKEDIAKTGTAKNDADKVEDPSKTEVQSLADGQKNIPSLASSQPDVAKVDTETKSLPVATVLISEEQAIKIAQQQHKGTKESISFVKTNEGGYYLISIKSGAPEAGTKESSKGKATIQVHAISGKILSVTLE